MHGIDLVAAIQTPNPCISTAPYQIVALHWAHLLGVRGLLEGGKCLLQFFLGLRHRDSYQKVLFSLYYYVPCLSVWIAKILPSMWVG